MKYLFCIILFIASPTIFADKITLSTVPRVETLFGINSMHNTIQIQVVSNGCTTNESFLVQTYIDRTDEMIHLNFIRIRHDWCKAFLPMGVWLKFSKAELDISNKDIVRIDNPFGPNQRVKNENYIF